MDFSALIAELRDIANKYNGRDIDSNVSTAMYCEMFRKILQKAESEVTAYDDQIVILWMTLSQLCQTYQTLTSNQERNSLYQHIFLLCAKVVLNIKWQQLGDEDQSKENFRATVEATHRQLVTAGFDRFGLLLKIMDNPWTDPTITKILSGDQDEDGSDSDATEEHDADEEEIKEKEMERKKRKEERKMKVEEEYTQYINKEDALILHLRVEMLMQENCEEWALNLCNCCLRQEKFKRDLEFKMMQLMLLFKLKHFDKLEEVCQEITCHVGVALLDRLEGKESNQPLVVRLIQIFLVQDWIQPDRNCCTKTLLQIWIKYQLLQDKDREKFLDSVWAIAKLSSRTEQICQLITGLLKKCGMNFIQLYTDLCVYAINVDKSCCEQQMLQGNMEGVRTRQHAISITCIKLADLYCNCSPKVARISALTAFALNPSIQNFNVVRKTYTDKRKEKLQAVKDDYSPQKEVKEVKPRQSRHLNKVNPSSLHEVERLLNMLRPYYLDPDMPFERLLPVCQRFMEEKGTYQQKKTTVKSSATKSNETASAKGKPSSKLQYYCDDTVSLQKIGQPSIITTKQSSVDFAKSSSIDVSKSVQNYSAKITSVNSPSSSKVPLFGLQPHSYRAVMTEQKVQSTSVTSPIRQTPAVQKPTQKLVPVADLMQSLEAHRLQQVSELQRSRELERANSANSITNLLKATKSIPKATSKQTPTSQPGFGAAPSPSPQLMSRQQSLPASQPQPALNINYSSSSASLKASQVPFDARRHSVNLPVSTYSDVIGNTGEKSVYHHLYTPKNNDKPQLKPPLSKLKVSNMDASMFTAKQKIVPKTPPANLQTFPSYGAQKLAMPGQAVSQSGQQSNLLTAEAASKRRPSADELQSIVDWLQAGTEDAMPRSSALQPKPAHDVQPSHASSHFFSSSQTGLSPQPAHYQHPTTSTTIKSSLKHHIQHKERTDGKLRADSSSAGGQPHGVLSVVSTGHVLPVSGQTTKVFSAASLQKSGLLTASNAAEIPSSVQQAASKTPKTSPMHQAASQIQQKLVNIQKAFSTKNPTTNTLSAQLLLNLQKKGLIGTTAAFGSMQQTPPLPSQPLSNTVQSQVSQSPLSQTVVSSTSQLFAQQSRPGAQKQLTDKDLSLEEMKNRIAEIVRQQREAESLNPTTPPKPKRSSSPRQRSPKSRSRSSSAASVVASDQAQIGGSPSKPHNTSSPAPSHHADQISMNNTPLKKSSSLEQLPSPNSQSMALSSKSFGQLIPNMQPIGTQPSPNQVLLDLTKIPKKVPLPSPSVHVENPAVTCTTVLTDAHQAATNTTIGLVPSLTQRNIQATSNLPSQETLLKLIASANIPQVVHTAQETSRPSSGKKNKIPRQKKTGNKKKNSTDTGSGAIPVCGPVATHFSTSISGTSASPKSVVSSHATFSVPFTSHSVTSNISYANSSIIAHSNTKSVPQGVTTGESSQQIPTICFSQPVTAHRESQLVTTLQPNISMHSNSAMQQMTYTQGFPVQQEVSMTPQIQTVAQQVVQNGVSLMSQSLHVTQERIQQGVSMPIQGLSVTPDVQGTQQNSQLAQQGLALTQPNLQVTQPVKQMLGLSLGSQLINMNQPAFQTSTSALLPQQLLQAVSVAGQSAVQVNPPNNPSSYVVQLPVIATSQQQIFSNLNPRAVTVGQTPSQVNTSTEGLVETHKVHDESQGMEYTALPVANNVVQASKSAIVSTSVNQNLLLSSTNNQQINIYSSSGSVDRHSMGNSSSVSAVFVTTTAIAASVHYPALQQASAHQLTSISSVPNIVTGFQERKVESMEGTSESVMPTNDVVSANTQVVNSPVNTVIDTTSEPHFGKEPIQMKTKHQHHMNLLAGTTPSYQNMKQSKSGQPSASIPSVINNMDFFSYVLEKGLQSGPDEKASVASDTFSKAPESNVGFNSSSSQDKICQENKQEANMKADHSENALDKTYKDSQLIKACHADKNIKSVPVLAHCVTNVSEVEEQKMQFEQVNVSNYKEGNIIMKINNDSESSVSQIKQTYVEGLCKEAMEKNQVVLAQQEGIQSEGGIVCQENTDFAKTSESNSLDRILPQKPILSSDVSKLEVSENKESNVHTTDSASSDVLQNDEKTPTDVLQDISGGSNSICDTDISRSIDETTPVNTDLLQGKNKTAPGNTDISQSVNENTPGNTDSSLSVSERTLGDNECSLSAAEKAPDNTDIPQDVDEKALGHTDASESLEEKALGNTDTSQSLDKNTPGITETSLSVDEIPHDNTVTSQIIEEKAPGNIDTSESPNENALTSTDASGVVEAKMPDNTDTLQSVDVKTPSNTDTSQSADEEASGSSDISKGVDEEAMEVEESPQNISEVIADNTNTLQHEEKSVDIKLQNLSVKKQRTNVNISHEMEMGETSSYQVPPCTEEKGNEAPVVDTATSQTIRTECKPNTSQSGDVVETSTLKGTSENGFVKHQPDITSRDVVVKETPADSSKKVVRGSLTDADASPNLELIESISDHLVENVSSDNSKASSNDTMTPLDVSHGGLQLLCASYCDEDSAESGDEGTAERVSVLTLRDRELQQGEECHEGKSVEDEVQKMDGIHKRADQIEQVAEQQYEEQNKGQATEKMQELVMEDKLKLSNEKSKEVPNEENLEKASVIELYSSSSVEVAQQQYQIQEQVTEKTGNKTNTDMQEQTKMREANEETDMSNRILEQKHTEEKKVETNVLSSHTSMLEKHPNTSLDVPIGEEQTRDLHVNDEDVDFRPTKEDSLKEFRPLEPTNNTTDNVNGGTPVTECVDTMMVEKSISESAQKFFESKKDEDDSTVVNHVFQKSSIDTPVGTTNNLESDQNTINVRITEDIHTSTSQDIPLDSNSMETNRSQKTENVDSLQSQIISMDTSRSQEMKFDTNVSLETGNVDTDRSQETNVNSVNSHDICLDTDKSQDIKSVDNERPQEITLDSYKSQEISLDIGNSQEIESVDTDSIKEQNLDYERFQEISSDIDTSQETMLDTEKSQVTSFYANGSQETRSVDTDRSKKSPKVKTDTSEVTKETDKSKELTFANTYVSFEIGNEVCTNSIAEDLTESVQVNSEPVTMEECNTGNTCLVLNNIKKDVKEMISDDLANVQDEISVDSQSMREINIDGKVKIEESGLEEGQIIAECNTASVPINDHQDERSNTDVDSKELNMGSLSPSIDKKELEAVDAICSKDICKKEEKESSDIVSTVAPRPQRHKAVKRMTGSSLLTKTRPKLKKMDESYQKKRADQLLNKVAKTTITNLKNSFERTSKPSPTIKSSKRKFILQSSHKKSKNHKNDAKYALFGEASLETEDSILNDEEVVNTKEKTGLHLIKSEDSLEIISSIKAEESDNLDLSKTVTSKHGQQHVVTNSKVHFPLISSGQHGMATRHTPGSKLSQEKWMKGPHDSTTNQIQENVMVHNQQEAKMKVQHSVTTRHVSQMKYPIQNQNNGTKIQHKMITRQVHQNEKTSPSQQKRTIKVVHVMKTRKAPIKEKSINHRGQKEIPHKGQKRTSAGHCVQEENVKVVTRQRKDIAVKGNQQAITAKKKEKLLPYNVQDRSPVIQKRGFLTKQQSPEITLDVASVSSPRVVVVTKTSTLKTLNSDDVKEREKVIQENESLKSEPESTPSNQDMKNRLSRAEISKSDSETGSTRPESPFSSAGSVKSFHSLGHLEEDYLSSDNTSSPPHCVICGMKFMSVVSLKHHVRNTCKSFGKSFSQIRDFEYCTFYKCEKCEHSSKSDVYMEEHIRRCAKGNDVCKMIRCYRCEMCGQTGQDKSLMMKHITKDCNRIKFAEKQKLERFKMLENEATMSASPRFRKSQYKVSSSMIVPSPIKSQSPSTALSPASSQFDITCKAYNDEHFLSCTLKTEKILIEKKEIQKYDYEQNKTLSDHELKGNITGSISGEKNDDVMENSQDNNAKVYTRQTRSKSTIGKVKDSVSDDNIGNIKSDIKNSVVEKPRTRASSGKGKKDVTGTASVLLSPKPTDDKKITDSQLKKEPLKNVAKMSTVGSDQSVTNNNRSRSRASSAGSDKQDCMSRASSTGSEFRLELRSSKRLRCDSGSTERSWKSDDSVDSVKGKRARYRQNSTMSANERECRRSSSIETIGSIEEEKIKKEGKKFPSSANNKTKTPAKVDSECPVLGKRVIKAKKYDQFEVPNFLKTRIEKSNIIRKFKSRRIAGKKICNKLFTSQTPPSKVYRRNIRKCPKCGQKFGSQGKLVKHISSIHLSPYKSKINPHTNKCTFVCNFCNTNFSNYVKFLKHVPDHSMKILDVLEQQCQGPTSDTKLSRQKLIAENMKSNPKDTITTKDAIIKDNLPGNEKDASKTDTKESSAVCDSDIRRSKRVRKNLDWNEYELGPLAKKPNSTIPQQKSTIQNAEQKIKIEGKNSQTINSKGTVSSDLDGKKLKVPKSSKLEKKGDAKSMEKNLDRVEADKKNKVQENSYSYASDVTDSDVEISFKQPIRKETGSEEDQISNSFTMDTVDTALDDLENNSHKKSGPLNSKRQCTNFGKREVSNHSNKKGNDLVKTLVDEEDLKCIKSPSKGKSFEEVFKESVFGKGKTEGKLSENANKLTKDKKIMKKESSPYLDTYQSFISGVNKEQTGRFLQQSTPDDNERKKNERLNESKVSDKVTRRKSRVENMEVVQNTVNEKTDNLVSLPTSSPSEISKMTTRRSFQDSFLLHCKNSQLSSPPPPDMEKANPLVTIDKCSGTLSTELKMVNFRKDSKATSEGKVIETTHGMRTRGSDKKNEVMSTDEEKGSIISNQSSEKETTECVKKKVLPKVTADLMLPHLEKGYSQASDPPTPEMAKLDTTNSSHKNTALCSNSNAISKVNAFQETFKSFICSPEKADQKDDSTSTDMLKAERENTLKSFRMQTKVKEPFTWDLEEGDLNSQRRKLPTIHDCVTLEKDEAAMTQSSVKVKMCHTSANQAAINPVVVMKSCKHIKNYSQLDCRVPEKVCQISRNQIEIGEKSGLDRNISNNPIADTQSSNVSDSNEGVTTVEMAKVKNRIKSSKSTSVRHMYHNGKIWQIGKGEVSSVAVSANCTTPSTEVTYQEEKMTVSGLGPNLGPGTKDHSDQCNMYIQTSLESLKQKKSKHTDTSKWGIHKKKRGSLSFQKAENKK